MLALANTTQSRPTITSTDMPLRIGFFTDTYAPSINGIAVSLQLLVSGLRAAGHQVTVFAPQVPDYDETDLQVHRIPAVQYMQMPPVYLAVPGTPRTTWALRQCQFDVLHAHSPLSIGMLAYLTAQAKHRPLIYTYHTSITDYTHYLKVGGQSRPVRWAARWFSATSTNLSDQVVVPSAKFKQLLAEQSVRRPIHTIPNGIDLIDFQRPIAKNNWRTRLNIDSESPILINVGRLAPEKRLDIVIAAFARIAARLPKAQLVIAGDGSSRSALEAQARGTGYGDRIHFLGMVNRAELPALLQSANVFVSASTSETQCLAMVEAIAAGLPVVAVWDEAFDGILVEGVNGRSAPREAEAFSTIVCELLADRRALQTFSQNSVKLSHKFSIEAQVSALVQLYRVANSRT